MPSFGAFRRWRGLVVVLAGVVLVTLAGCFGVQDSSEQSVGVTPSGCTLTDGEATYFGPWGSDIEAAYVSSVTSERAKQILCSGTITPEHVAEMNESLETCLTDVGFTNVSVDQYGSLQLTTPSGVSESTVESRERACEDSTGWYPVVSLYVNMTQNPNKSDLNQLIADCLVRVGLEPEGFTSDDVAAEYDGRGDGFADISAEPLFEACYFDPLHTS